MRNPTVKLPPLQATTAISGWSLTLGSLAYGGNTTLGLVGADGGTTE